MRTFGPLRFLVAITLTLVTAAFVAATQADELGASGAAHGLRIHGVAETLHDYCSTDAEGRTWLDLPGGARFELITSAADPAIPNSGDGSFHPFDEIEVRVTLEAIRYPLGSVRADVFLLPYPRRDGLESAAGHDLILLSPGVRPLSREQQHAELAHELGHVVQYTLMPDSDSKRWEAYRSLRGIEDRTIYAATSIHADRPHEIFAEDFRALFGDALARYSGSIENGSLTRPAEIDGLDRFMLALGGVDVTTQRLVASPNPSRGALRFSSYSRDPVLLDVFDAAGRRIATLSPKPVAAGLEWNWDGRGAGGRAVGTGVVFARPRDGATRAARVTLIR